MKQKHDGALVEIVRCDQWFWSSDTLVRLLYKRTLHWRPLVVGGGTIVMYFLIKFITISPFLFI